jgi:hypothetical protein
MVKQTKKETFLVLISILILSIIFSSNTSAVTNADQNISIESQASNCINESVSLLYDLIDNNFVIDRVNDSLTQAQNLYQSQAILKEKKQNYDFSLVIPHCKDILKIHDDALDAKDEYIALLKFYNDSITPELNTSSVDKTLSEIKIEIANERYENVKVMIDKAYEQIINIKSSQTTLNLFYRSTTRGIGALVRENWVFIISIFFVFLILIFIYFNTIKRLIIKRKVKNLEVRKTTLKSLIMKTQKDYFQSGGMSESTYTLKIKKFAELVRDIERQIPLLNEEIAKINQKKNKKEKSK